MTPEDLAAYGAIAITVLGAISGGLTFYVRSIVAEKESMIDTLSTRVAQIAQEYDRRLSDLDKDHKITVERMRQIEKEALTRSDRQEMLGAIKDVGDRLSKQIQDLSGDVTHLVDRVSRVEANN